MTFRERVEEQWAGYAKRHRNRVNLIIHIVTVPMIWFGAVWALGGALLMLMGVTGAFGMLVASALLIALALFGQSRGNALENQPPLPSDSIKDLLLGFVAEQFITFPRFVMSGAWLHNFRNAPRSDQAG